MTQYIVDVALGGYLKRQEKALTEQLQLEQIPKQATKQRREAEIQFWEAYRDILLKTRVIDPACGSGAFLIAAFDYLNREYERVNEALAALAFASQTKGKGSGEIVGQRSLFDLNKTLLNENLYGVDLSPESVEITKLSLWLKTAEQGKALTYLDDNIKVGNSIVADPSLDPRGFNWAAEFPQVFADGGFDVVIGNPPYVRQELLSPIKPYLQQHYESYDGVADLYTYFYEKGLKILKPDGVLSYIVTNKWFKAGYGEPLRRFFAQNSVFEQILDFGHAPIFADADVFPCIVSVRTPVGQASSLQSSSGDDNDNGQGLSSEEDSQDACPTVRVCPVPREKLSDINLPQYVQQEGYDIPWSRFTADAWSMEPPAVDELMQKIKSVGVALKDFVGVKPYYGIKTGLNEAFLIDDDTRNRLVKADPSCAEIIKPYLRGRDIDRWIIDNQEEWIIFARRGIDIDLYPTIKNHLISYRTQLEPRPHDWDATKNGQWAGRKPGTYEWYEIQDSVDYYWMFEQPKIIYQVIQFLPQYALDISGGYGNDKTYFLPTADLYLLGLLNSPLMWWHNWRFFGHMKDEALNPANFKMESLPIAPPTDEIRSQVEAIATRLIEITKANQEASREVLDWLQVEQHIDKLGQKLENFASLDCDQFVQEVKTRKPKGSGLSPKILKELREVYGDYAPSIQTRRAEALTLETRLSDLINQAYGLTPEEIDLMWKTAPPRMPIPKPHSPIAHLSKDRT